MSDRGVEVVFYALLLILPLAALIARRPLLKRTLLLALIWTGIFIVALLVIGQRDRFGILLRGAAAEGRETRIDMAPDGHFWAEVVIDGVSRRMLIDSGATTTALSEATARAARLEPDSPFPVVLNTANGQVTASTATATSVSVGGVTTRDLPVVISSGHGGTDVVGMNFLSRLDGWRVEGRTLVLAPRPPSR